MVLNHKILCTLFAIMMRMSFIDYTGLNIENIKIEHLIYSHDEIC